MNKKLFLDEIMAYCKYDDHIKEHKAINEMFEIDCDNVSVEEHLTYHLEYKFRTNQITEDQYKRYKE